MLLASGGTTHPHIELLLISKVRRITAASHGSVHATDHMNHRGRMPKPYYARSAPPLPGLGPVPGGARRARKVVLAARAKTALGSRRVDGGRSTLWRAPAGAVLMLVFRVWLLSF